MPTMLFTLQLQMGMTCAKCGRHDDVNFKFEGNDVTEGIRHLDEAEAETLRLCASWEVGENHKPYCSQKCREEYGVKRLET